MSEDHANSKEAKESVSCANFELGVLFGSRFQHKPTDLIYCWMEASHLCERSGFFSRDGVKGCHVLFSAMRSLNRVMAEGQD
jgi:hypothetical protein